MPSQIKSNIQNPWRHLPKHPPYALASDLELLESFNAQASHLHRYDLSLLPEPFFGSDNAAVVVLNLNPGWSEEDALVHADPAFIALARKSIEHKLKPHPFLHLQPGSQTPGAQWWRRRTQELVNDIGLDQVVNHLACIELTPYHSQQYSARTPLLPSQEYSFHLVRKSMERGAEIVIMRSVKLWFAAVPELANYRKLHLASNPRAPFISRGNLKSSYDVIMRKLRNAK